MAYGMAFHGMTWRIASAALALGMVTSACSSGVSRDEYDAEHARADELAASLSSTQDELTEARAALTEAEGAAEAAVATSEELERNIATLEDQLASTQGLLVEERNTSAQLEDDLAAAREDAAEAQQAAQDLLLAFDPEIQAARAQLVDQATPIACDLGTQAATLGASTPPSATAVLQELEGIETAVDFDVQDLVDLGALAATAASCFEEQQANLVLYGPHGSGFFTVGVEIGPGLWQSTGSGSGCYWERLDSNQEILDNHFGSAGGTVRIRASDYEVHFDDCGTWEYSGS
jgi:multidrug efflux pump subunit AcrA (membrane-fusion protein)